MTAGTLRGFAAIPHYDGGTVPRPAPAKPPKDPYAGLSNEQLAQIEGALRATGSDFETIAPGYTQDKRTGQVLYNGKPVDAAQAMAAAVDYHSTIAAAGRAPVHPTPQIDKKTGELVMVSPDGTVKQTGYFPDFPGIDPADEFAQKEAVRGFNEASQARQDAINAVSEANKNVISLADSAERARREGLTADAEDRRAQLSAAVSQYNEAMRLIPELGALSISESKQVQDIMQNGGDFIARSFASSGATPPGAPVLQADQINTLRTQTNQVRAMISDSLQRAGQAMDVANARRPMADTGYRPPTLQGYGNIPGLPPFQPIVPGANRGVPAVTPTAPSAAPSTGGGFVGTASPGDGRGPAYPVQIPAGPGGPGFLSDTGSAVSAPVQAADTGDNTPWWSMGGVANALGNVAGAVAPALTAPISETGAARALGNAVSGAGGFLQDRLSDAGSLFGGWLSGTGGSGQQPQYPVQIPAGPGGPTGYKAGGFTRAPMFLGNEKGAELFMNPEHAPIGIVNAATTKKIGMQPHGFAGYATGTGALGPNDAPFGTYEGPSGPRAVSQIGGDNPGYAPGGGFASSLPRAAMSPMVTQSELVASAMRNSSPRISAAFGGTPIMPQSALPSTIDSTQFLRPFTSRQLGSLTGEEQQALGTRTNVGFNAPLSYIQNQTRGMYAPADPLNALYSRWFSGFTGVRGLGER